MFIGSLHILLLLHKLLAFTLLSHLVEEEDAIKTVTLVDFADFVHTCFQLLP